MPRIVHNQAREGDIGRRGVCGKVVKTPPGGGAWGDNLPANFSWLVVNQVAGSACPQSELELRSLAGVGINHVVTLSQDAKPPDCIVNIPNLKWTLIPIQNFHGASIAEFNTFFHLWDTTNRRIYGGEDDYSGNGGAVLVHCKSGWGRTGMFLAAYLMRFSGVSAVQSMTAVRAARPRSIETKEQEESLRQLEDFLRQ